MKKVIVLECTAAACFGASYAVAGAVGGVLAVAAFAFSSIALVVGAVDNWKTEKGGVE